MHAAAQQGAHLLRESEYLLANLEDRHLGLEPVPGTKTAGWLLGHLVITGDFGRRLCGLAPLSPKEWRVGYAPGTTPSWDASTYPAMRDLLAAFRSVYADLVAHAPLTPADVLAAPNPFPPTRDAFPTAGDFVQYLIAGHLGYHLGQLSIWRATAAAADPGLRGSSLP